MDNYPSNSKTAPPKDNPPEKRVEKMILGQAVVQKRSLGQRFKSAFIGGDDARSVWQYLAQDVIVPQAKDLISDMVAQGIDRLLFGESRSRARNRLPQNPVGPGPYVNYRQVSTPAAGQPQRPAISNQARESHDFGQIRLETRAEAEAVLDRLIGLIQQYESTTVADLYNAVGITPSFTDQRWGWTNLNGASVIRNHGAYILNLPQTVALT